MLVVVKSQQCNTEETKEIMENLRIQVANYSASDDSNGKRGNIFKQFSEEPFARAAQDKLLTVRTKAEASDSTTDTTNTLDTSTSGFLDSSNIFRQLRCLQQVEPQSCTPNFTTAPLTDASTSFPSSADVNDTLDLALDEQPSVAGNFSTNSTPYDDLQDDNSRNSSDILIDLETSTGDSSKENDTAASTTTETNPTPTGDDKTEAPALITADGDGTTSNAGNETASASSSNGNRWKASLLFSFLVGFLSFWSAGSRSGTTLAITIASLGMIAAVFALCEKDSFSVGRTATSQGDDVLALSSSLDLVPIRKLATSDECTINVEVTYFGCNTYMNVKAPAMELRNLILNSTFDIEACNCTALSTFPSLNDSSLEGYGFDYGANNTVTTIEMPFPVSTTSGSDDLTQPDTGMTMTMVQQVPLAKDAGACMMAVGRPFRDLHGNTILSHPQQGGQQDHSTNKPGLDYASLWSQPKDPRICEYYASFSPTERGPFDPLSSTIKTTNRQQPNWKQLESDWTHRALGEHASIASFATFSIALMSNGAPPDLILDSLEAAKDEVRHAKVSFEAASLLAGMASADVADGESPIFQDSTDAKIVEPAALPPSHHYFSPNMTALALGVIREGCFDETLSALQMAIQVDAFSALPHPDELTRMLMNVTRTIALEEGKHSALAWRTIHWICQVDTTACNNIKSELILSDDALGAIGSRRVLGAASAADRPAVQAWMCLHKHLVQLVTANQEGGTSSTEGPLLAQASKTLIPPVCDYEKLTNHPQTLEGNRTETLVSQLFHEIYAQVAEHTQQYLSVVEVE